MMIHDVQTNGGVLHEDLSFYDLERKDIPIDANDIELNEEEKAAFVDFFRLSNVTYTKEQSKALNEEVATQMLKEDGKMVRVIKIEIHTFTDLYVNMVGRILNMRYYLKI